MLPLVEIIRCADTVQEALDIGFAFTKGIGKLPFGMCQFARLCSESHSRPPIWERR